jgi:exonuclease III
MQLMFACVGLLGLLREADGLPSNTLSVMSYNIMDSGFADESGKYDPVGDRIPGNLSNFMASQSPFVDVLGLIETSSWGSHDTSTHPGYLTIAKSWGYEHVHVRSNCAIMSHAPMTIVDEPSVGSSTIVAQVLNTTFIVTSFGAYSSKNKYLVGEAMANYVMAHYQDEPLILMGDLNSVSPQDRPRYNETLLCGNGIYDAAAQTGEYVSSYCLQQTPSHTPSPTPAEWTYDETTGIKWCSGGTCLIDGSGQCGAVQADLFGAGVVNKQCVKLPTTMNETEQITACEKACSSATECAGFTFYVDDPAAAPARDACFRTDCSRKPPDPNSTVRCYQKHGFKPITTWGLDFKPMTSLLNNSDLVDLCFVSGGFYDTDTDNLAYPSSQCGFSNPTLLIHMAGHYSDEYSGSRAHDHATAKIDYILANKKMLETNRFHHTNVIKTLQADGCSDHYPIEAVFMA